MAAGGIDPSGCRGRRHPQPSYRAALRATTTRDSHGRRGGLLLVEIQDAAQIPALTEPWFLALGASVELHPVMLPADLARAAPAITEIAK